MFFLKKNFTGHVEESLHLHPDVLSIVDFFLQVWKQWKKLFSRNFSLKPSSAEVERNDDNLAGNNFPKSPKYFASMPDKIL